MIFEYPGVIAFLVMDAAILIAATTLLTVQATQVKDMSLFLPFHVFQFSVCQSLDLLSI